MNNQNDNIFGQPLTQEKKQSNISNEQNNGQLINQTNQFNELNNKQVKTDETLKDMYVSMESSNNKNIKYGEPEEKTEEKKGSYGFLFIILIIMAIVIFLLPYINKLFDKIYNLIK